MAPQAALHSTAHGSRFAVAACSTGLSRVKVRSRLFVRLCKLSTATFHPHDHARTMALDPKQHSLAEFEALSAHMSDLLARAQALPASTGASTAHAAPGHAPLHGKKLGLVCGVADDHGAVLFTRAANALGAQVALLRPSLSVQSTAEEVQRTARVLGRLYDALDCIGLPHDLVMRIAADAGVPVFEGLASAAHPAYRHARPSATETGTDEWRCLVIQAVLLGALG